MSKDGAYQHMQRKDNIVLQRLVQEWMRKLLRTCLKLTQQNVRSDQLREVKYIDNLETFSSALRVTHNTLCNDKKTKFLKLAMHQQLLCYADMNMPTQTT